MWVLDGIRCPSYSLSLRCFKSVSIPVIDRPRSVYSNTEVKLEICMILYSIQKYYSSRFQFFKIRINGFLPNNNILWKWINIYFRNGFNCFQIIRSYNLGWWSLRLKNSKIHIQTHETWKRKPVMQLIWKTFCITSFIKCEYWMVYIVLIQ